MATQVIADIIYCHYVLLQMYLSYKTKTVVNPIQALSRTVCVNIFESHGGEGVK